ncbi:MAG: trypsin-like peptidase domain-containing protein [Clostridiales bacterium]|nr:trypsin-like peptidase domain-containing protein [Clostridiales bacterium]
MDNYNNDDLNISGQTNSGDTSSFGDTVSDQTGFSGEAAGYTEKETYAPIEPQDIPAYGEDRETPAANPVSVQPDSADDAAIAPEVNFGADAQPESETIRVEEPHTSTNAWTAPNVQQNSASQAPYGAAFGGNTGYNGGQNTSYGYNASAPYGSSQQSAGQNPYNNSYAGGQNTSYGYNGGYNAPYSQQQYSPYGQHNYNTQQFSGSSYNNQPPAKKKKNGLKVFFVLLAVVVALAVVFGIVASVVRSNGGRANNNNNTNYNTYVDSGSGNKEEKNSPELETNHSPTSSGSVSGSTTALAPSQIAEKVKPSVVGIIVYSKNSGSISSQGSGIIWKEDSTHTYTYIITCAHVISGTDTCTVQTENGTQYDGDIVGADSKTDLGVIRIKATGLPAAEFGDSSALKVGDPIYAIGNPGGTEFFGSFTSGVVSAIDRSVESTYTMECIQHDAAINPGNSGGALVNCYGQVVGINSLKIVNTEYEGMGFAIPVKTASSVVTALAKYGYVPNRAKIGITYAEATNYQQYNMIVKLKGLPSGSLIITKIDSASDLANSDARQYDMIVGVNGKELTTPSVLLDIIDNSKPGDTVTLKLCRIDSNYNTKTFDVKIKLIEDKGDSVKEETTTQINPFDFFNGFNDLF